MSIDLKLKYLKPVSKGTITASGTCIRSGRSIIHAEARVEDAAGELPVNGTSTPMALPGKGIHPEVEKFIEDKKIKGEGVSFAHDQMRLTLSKWTCSAQEYLFPQYCHTLSEGLGDLGVGGAADRSTESVATAYGEFLPIFGDGCHRRPLVLFEPPDFRLQFAAHQAVLNHLIEEVLFDIDPAQPLDASQEGL